MFVTKSQIFVFIACVAIGGVGGIFFAISDFIKLFIKNERFRFLPDIAAFSLLAVWYGFASFMLRFPSYRFYMTVGVVSGLFLYMKSFRLTLDLWMKKLYNVIIKTIAAIQAARTRRINNAKNGKKRRNGKRAAITTSKRNVGSKGGAFGARRRRDF